MADYPQARDAIFALLDGHTLAGHVLTVYYRLGVDYKSHLPAVLIYHLGGSEGYIDRTDRVGVDVYATEGTPALDILEQIRDLLVPGPHDTSAGFIDDVAVESLPVDTPYADPAVSFAQMVVRVTARPL